MKRSIALILALLMLCTASVALAEEEGAGEPLFATVGDALAAAGEEPVAGGEEDYYAVVTEKDGQYYRSVAWMDDKAKELQKAILEADIDHLEEAFAAADEYIRTLPIAYSEVFTAVPLEQEQLDALVGMTIGALREAGYEERESGTNVDENEEIIIVYVLRNGLFDYRCVVDTDLDAYDKAQAGELNDGDFVVKSVKLRGITHEACLKRFHTDGTIDEVPDPFAAYTEMTLKILDMIQRTQSGEEVDAEAFFADLKGQYPDLVETVDFYFQMYQMLGPEELAELLAPAE